MEHSDFREMVAAVLQELPRPFRDKLRNIDVVIEEVPPAGRGLLGLYQGVPLKKRSIFYGNILPDKITLYRKNIERMAQLTGAPLKEWVERVLFHEIGHHFGFDEESLRELEPEK
jgi:predicted Zn-dependent protease with MMP-like domain